MENQKELDYQTGVYLDRDVDALEEEIMENTDSLEDKIEILEEQNG